MGERRNNNDVTNGGWGEFFWNLVGGAMIATMVAGMLYVLIAMIGQHLYQKEQYWELHYFLLYFTGVFAFYVLAPKLLASILGGVFGSKPNAMKRR